MLSQNVEEIFLAVKKANSLSGKNIIEQVVRSGLRGMGGAGFPTGIKWNAVNCSSSAIKYVVANGHEGEPFTLKDKFLMLNFPHQIIAGTLIAARAISSKKIYIVVNNDYKEEIKVLKNAIKDFKKAALLNDIDINITKAEKRYIGGEESALLNELQGKRIEPRAKSPLVCNCGLNGAPTIVNNIETLAQVPSIILGGFAKYKKEAKKLVTISGDIKNPGVYSISIGSSLESLINIAGGSYGKSKFAIVGGYSGNVVMPKDFKNKLSFEFKPKNIYLGAGTIIVYNNKTKVLEILENLFTFYKNESCGQCTPCREGTTRLYEIIKNTKSKISKEDIEKINELIFALDNSSFCAFGQCVGMAAKGLFINFRKEILSAK